MPEARFRRSTTEPFTSQSGRLRWTPGAAMSRTLSPAKQRHRPDIGTEGVTTESERIGRPADKRVIRDALPLRPLHGPLSEAAMIDLRKTTLTLAEARDQLHDMIWPGAQYEPGTPDESKAKKDPDTSRLLTGALEGYTLNLQEDRMAEIDSEILAALRRDDLCIRYECGGRWRHFGPDHWRDMEDQSALVQLSLGRLTVSDNEIGRDLPMTLVRKEFDDFKRHVMNGNPARLVDLSDALAFIAAGTGNEV